jgi:zinc transport system permease protein
MDFIGGIFEYQFLRNAFLAAILSGVACGIIGTYIVARRLVFLSGGITHASFGGIGIAYWLGVNPVMGALVFAVLSSLGIEWGAGRGKIREDSAIGIVWSVGMAMGIIFIYLTPGYAPNLMSFLFGNILTVTDASIAALGGLVLLLLILALFFLRPVMYVAFDREFARSRGVPVAAVSYVMAVFMALAIVLSIRSVGIVLLISLLTIPAVIVNSLTRSFTRIVWWSAAVAVAGNLMGLYISYKVDIPAGAATIIVLALTLVIVKILPLCRTKKAPSSENDR